MIPEFVSVAISRVKNDPTIANSIQYSSNLSMEPNVLVFKPESHGPLKCQECAEDLRLLETYTGERKDYPGRWLFDFQKNAYLVTHMYQCNTCGIFPGTDDSILLQCKNNNQFLLTHKNGWTLRILQKTIYDISRGNFSNFHEFYEFFNV